MLIFSKILEIHHFLLVNWNFLYYDEGGLLVTLSFANLVDSRIANKHGRRRSSNMPNLVANQGKEARFQPPRVMAARSQIAMDENNQRLRDYSSEYDGLHVV